VTDFRREVHTTPWTTFLYTNRYLHRSGPLSVKFEGILGVCPLAEGAVSPCKASRTSEMMSFDDCDAQANAPTRDTA